MRSAALTSTTRSALSVMVEKEARRVGSRTVAYKNVANMIGMSASWVTKFIADTGEVSEPRMTLFQKIRVAYNNTCERIEAENRADEQRWQTLRGSLNEIDTSLAPQGHSEMQNLVEE